MANNRPVVVSILAVLAYIGAVFSLLGGIAMLFGSAFLGAMLAKLIPSMAMLATAGTVLLIVLGIIFIGLAVLDYFVGKGLWNGKNWARILVIIFAALGVLGSIWPFNIVGLVIDGLVVWYLGFYKPAIAYFK